MKPHKHAEVLRAIADGVPLSEFEVSRNDVFWAPLSEYQIKSLDEYDIYIRRKPQYIMVNGFKVPKPLSVKPDHGYDYYGPSFDCKGFYESYTWNDDRVDERMFERNVIHLTPEAAIAHAKSMLGIDPEAK